MKNQPRMTFKVRNSVSDRLVLEKVAEAMNNINARVLKRECLRIEQNKVTVYEVPESAIDYKRGCMVTRAIPWLSERDNSKRPESYVIVTPFGEPELEYWSRCKIESSMSLLSKLFQ
jgi:hypothetical protein